jgi:hypothetical protein
MHLLVTKLSVIDPLLLFVSRFNSGDCYYSATNCELTDVTLNDLYDATAKIATTGYGPFRTVALIKYDCRGIESCKKKKTPS